MISINKNYITKSGTTVVIHAIYPDQELQQVQGALVYPGFVQMQSWDIDGRFNEKAEGESILDLLEVE